MVLLTVRGKTRIFCECSRNNTSIVFDPLTSIPKTYTHYTGNYYLNAKSPHSLRHSLFHLKITTVYTHWLMLIFISPHWKKKETNCIVSMTNSLINVKFTQLQLPFSFSHVSFEWRKKNVWEFFSWNGKATDSAVQVQLSSQLTAKCFLVTTLKCGHMSKCEIFLFLLLDQNFCFIMTLC